MRFGKYARMRNFLFASALCVGASAHADTILKTDLPFLLKRPLIVGASVSADHKSQSPGKRLSLRYTSADQIVTIAHGGKPGKDVLASMPTSFLKDRTAVIAVDLFFWDSTLGSPTASIAALKKLVDQVKKQNLPIVLGEIPELLPGRQSQRSRLNSELQNACASYDKCRLMPFIDLHAKVMRDGFLMIGGKRYGLRELLPDGLHLSETASDYLADQMRDVLLRARSG